MTTSLKVCPILEKTYRPINAANREVPQADKNHLVRTQYIDCHAV